jgi:hypothetical protein
MIQAWRPIAYSLIKRQDGSNSGLSACKPIMISATAAGPTAAIRDGMAIDESAVTSSSLAGTTSVEQMISFGMPSDTMAELANALADIGRHAKPRGVNEKLAELAFDFVLAGRRAEQVASAVSLSEKWKLQRTAA